MTVQDYVQSLLAALENLSRSGVHPKGLIGFSMGGAVVQLAQQTLTDSGTNLRSEFNIKNVVLLAPSPPEGFPFFFADQFRPFSNLFYFCHTGEGGGLKSDICASIDVDVASEQIALYEHITGDLSDQGRVGYNLDDKKSQRFLKRRTWV